MSRILTISTAGSVDDGKSTLLGRLVHDTQGLLSDNAAALSQGEEIDFSRVTDGLVAEREQGITIDVAWRHLDLGHRRYLLADAPGHEQYTRNLVTAASHADALIVLVDPTRLDLSNALPSLLKQTHRHAAIAHLLRVPHVSFVINKLDLFEDAERITQQVSRSLNALITQVGLDQTCVDIAIIAASALTGENIAVRGQRLDWYQGPTVLEWLDQIAEHLEQGAEESPLAVLPVQTSLRTQGSGLAPFRGIAGRLAQGRLAVNQRVTTLPGQQQATIVSIWRHGEEVQQAYVSESITLVLDRDLDISRGDWIVGMSNASQSETLSPITTIHARVCWLSEQPGPMGSRLMLKIGSREIQARIQSSLRRFDPESLDFTVAETGQGALSLQLNEIHDVVIQLAEPLWIESDSIAIGVLNRFLLMHTGTWATVGAGVIQTQAFSN
ncbi:MAG: sulfate adenylyltransferase [Burkholderiaceae bacterium]|nr:sulfate adenylyltransferase [Burkholderiaceae bacterium]